MAAARITNGALQVRQHDAGVDHRKTRCSVH